MLKQSYVNFRDKPYMRMVLEKALEYVITENDLAEAFETGRFNEMIRLLIGMTKGDLPRIELYEYEFQRCAFILTCLNTVWMDVYFLLRAFKTPDGFDYQATLCTTFFGHDQSKCIAYLLTDVMDLYEIQTVSLSSPPDDRCTGPTEST